MNISDTLLNALEVTTEPFAICDIKSGSVLELKPDSSVTVHYVLRGSGVLITSDCLQTEVKPYQVIVMPSGMAQRIEASSDAVMGKATSSVCRNLSDNVASLNSTEQNETNIVLACSRVKATYDHETDIFSCLSEPIVESFCSNSQITAAFHTMLREYSKPGFGTLALADSLMKQSMILLLRRLRENDDYRVPLLAVVNNKGLQKALNAILTTPEKEFKVRDLANIASMSRSAFAEQFHRTFGQPPHVFLSSYRLRRAAQLLLTTDKSVESISVNVGFRSRSSFSRAFKAKYNVDPAKYRAKDRIG